MPLFARGVRADSLPLPPLRLLEDGLPLLLLLSNGPFEREAPVGGALFEWKMRLYLDSGSCTAGVIARPRCEAFGVDGLDGDV